MITHGSPTWALNQTFSRSGKFNFGASHRNIFPPTPSAAGPRASLSPFFPSSSSNRIPLPLPLASHLLPLSWWRNAAMKFSPPTRRSTCRNVPVKYSRGFMAAFQSIIGVYPWKIKRHPSWPRTSACQSIDARRVSRSLSRFLFFIFSILVHTLSSRPFIFDVVAFHSGFLVAPLLFFDLFIFSFFSYFFFLFQTALGEARNGKGTSRRYHCRIFAWKTPRRKPLVLSSFDAARARTKLRA